ncbi:Amino acid/polyamine transporter I [Corchorus olitorius]|uniref:Amino acid/polyamine transporter I n=1 Tax=Corchorus olitorius TaxID=93759 RepID=A0A1R3L3B4_9ROSI|nr:Amino acid/polyamine transporter I [Corchorus olitorius]
MTGGIVAATPELTTTVSNVSLFLLLKAFSSGCSALTGVEAVSNAIPNFRQPAERNAAATLVMMGVILGSMFIGISLLAYWYGISPRATETVISQIARMTFGSGVVYFIIQGVTALILFLAANTAYSAFPLLAFMLAKDKYMPHMFMVRGDRLGFSNGIIFLSLASALLVIVFHGETDSLIPLYAVGVFIPFTLSQLGMMIRWIKHKPAHWVLKLIINTIGMLTTLSITLIFIFTKFAQVWIIFIFLPIVVYLFYKIYIHYRNTAEQLRIDLDTDKPQAKGNTIIIPVAGITQVVKNTISYAQTLSPNVVAVYVGFDEESTEKMERKWEQWNPGVRLIVLRSRYRSILGPLRRFIDTVEWKQGEKDHITILIPQFVTKHWWESILHNQTSLLMRAYLINYKDVVDDGSHNAKMGTDRRGLHKDDISTGGIMMNTKRTTALSAVAALGIILSVPAYASASSNLTVPAVSEATVAAPTAPTAPTTPSTPSISSSSSSSSNSSSGNSSSSSSSSSSQNLSQRLVNIAGFSTAKQFTGYYINLQRAVANGNRSAVAKTCILSTDGEC